MSLFVRLVLGFALLLAVVAAAILIFKLALFALVLAGIAYVALFAVNLVRALARRSGRRALVAKR